MGYNFVLDADISPGETDDGKFRVFIELERNRHAPEQIFEVVQGIKKLANIDEMKFRYFKGFSSFPCTVDNLTQHVPTDGDLYQQATSDNFLENYDNFFSSSTVDQIDLINESIVFISKRALPITFKVVASGCKENVYQAIKGPIMLESKDIASVLYLTKHIGDYNITKIGIIFIFENNNYAVAMEQI